MSLSRFDDAVGGRPVWLVTLADLALLLIGFFVFLQASQIDRRALTNAIRRGFDAPPIATMPEPIALDHAVVRGFATGDATLPADVARGARWLRGAASDRRTRLRVTGHVDGSDDDRDALTGSAALLASDRARAVAAALVASGAIPGDRIAIATDTAATGRHVTLAIGFAGADEPHRQPLAARQRDLAASSQRSQP